MEASIKNLTTDQKIALAEELWDEIELERTAHLTKDQLELLEERRKNHIENPSSGISLRNFIKKYK